MLQTVLLRFLTTLSLFAMSTTTFAETNQNMTTKATDHVKHLQDFQVIEFRRYTIKQGEREHFAEYFESYFPEAFQQMGAIVFGQFFERKNAVGFTWMRGFKNNDARAIVNSAFYYGPLWREHASTMNSLMVDSDNVLLLRPLSPGRGIAVLPAVDPIKEENGAQGVVVAQIFAVKPNSVDAFVQKAQATFESYRAAGAREAGVLATLDVPNNFPQLPVRTDGPYLVWLGIVKDNQALESFFIPLAARSTESLSTTGLLRNAPELVILDPTDRSRLRWLSDEQK
jgi:NIPSNAP